MSEYFNGFGNSAYLCQLYKCTTLSHAEYQCTMIKVDWLAAGVLLKEVGAELVILTLSWHTICKYFHPMGNKFWWLTKSFKPC